MPADCTKQARLSRNLSQREPLQHVEPANKNPVQFLQEPFDIPKAAAKVLRVI